MRRFLMVGLGLVLGICAPGVGRAFDPDHLTRLIETGACFACDLKGADLSGLDLSGADLASAVLIGADFTKANLKDADMRNTQLNEARFLGADLSGVVMTKSIVTGADFRGARFEGAAFYDIDFSMTNADLGALADARLCSVMVKGGLLLFDGC